MGRFEPPGIFTTTLTHQLLRVLCRVLLLTACISFVAMIYHLIICFPSPHVMPRVDLMGYRRFAAWACSWWVSNIMWNPRTEDVWEQIEALPRISISNEVLLKIICVAKLFSLLFFTLLHSTLFFKKNKTYWFRQRRRPCGFCVLPWGWLYIQTCQSNLAVGLILPLTDTAISLWFREVQTYYCCFFWPLRP